MSSQPSPENKITLYHRIAHIESARLRKVLVERGLTDRVQFRNIDASQEANQKLRAAAGEEKVPAAEFAGDWFFGMDAILKIF